MSRWVLIRCRCEIKPMGKRLLITAGPTREPIDAVRFIGNRSSGQMGLAIAQAAADAGHEVVLLLGPVGDQALSAMSSGVTVERFETTEQLQGLLNAHQEGFEVLIMAAAVADYRVVQGRESGKKIERQEAGGRWVLELEPTPDLVAGVCGRKRADQRVVAFALEETGKLQERAVAKMKRKGVEAIVANPLETMDSGEIDGMLIWVDGRIERPSGGTSSKPAFARWLVERVTG